LVPYKYTGIEMQATLDSEYKFCYSLNSAQ